jgi:hypothetical protein
LRRSSPKDDDEKEESRGRLPHPKEEEEEEEEFLPWASLYKNEVMGGRDVEADVDVQGASSMGISSSFRSQIEEVEEQEGEVKKPFVVSADGLPMGRADTNANWVLPFLGVLELELRERGEGRGQRGAC